MIYFISDTHFGDTSIIRNERFQFNSIEEHDQFIIDSVNKVVKKTDELWILGDIGNPEKVSQLNGRKYMVIGNHDRRTIKEYESYFAAVYHEPFLLDRRILLSHQPWPVPQGYLNVHGHLHLAYLDSNNHFNISFHMIEYKPVLKSELERRLGLLEKPDGRFLLEWYAPLYVFTTEKPDVVVDENNKVKVKESLELRAKLFGERK